MAQMKFCPKVFQSLVYITYVINVPPKSPSQDGYNPGIIVSFTSTHISIVQRFLLCNFHMDNSFEAF